MWEDIDRYHAAMTPSFRSFYLLFLYLRLRLIVFTFSIVLGGQLRMSRTIEYVRAYQQPRDGKGQERGSGVGRAKI